MKFRLLFCILLLAGYALSAAAQNPAFAINGSETICLNANQS